MCNFCGTKPIVKLMDLIYETWAERISEEYLCKFIIFTFKKPSQAHWKYVTVCIPAKPQIRWSWYILLHFSSDTSTKSTINNIIFSFVSQLFCGFTKQPCVRRKTCPCTFSQNYIALLVAHFKLKCPENVWWVLLKV